MTAARPVAVKLDPEVHARVRELRPGAAPIRALPDA